MSKFKQFHYHLNTRKLPKGSKDLTFILMADMHNHVYGPGNRLLLEAVEAQKPDAVLISGDMLSDDEFAELKKILEGQE